VRRPCTVHWLYNNFWRYWAPKDKVWPVNCKYVRRPCKVHWLYNNFWRYWAPKDKVWPINCKYVGRQLNCVVIILLM
jgi:hypothetical protein